MKFKRTSKFHIPVSVKPQPPKPTKPKFQKFFTDPLLIVVQWIRHYPTIAMTAIHDGLVVPCDRWLIFVNWVRHYITIAATAVHDGLVAPLRDLWGNHYPRLANMQRQVAMPHSPFGFIMAFMFAFAAMKAQGQPGFPFKTHLPLVKFLIGFALMYWGLVEKHRALKNDIASSMKAITSTHMVESMVVQNLRLINEHHCRMLNQRIAISDMKS